MDVYLASGNAHKLEEFSELVQMHGLILNLYGAGFAGGMPDVEESGHTFEENAKIKAEALLELVPDKAWVLSDDSGLLVDALNGEPGIHSARYAGENGNSQANNLKLLQKLEGVPIEERSARFACVLYFIQKGMPGNSFSGTCEGHILTTPSGNLGFGYDPLFQPVGYTQTFAELGSAVKQKLSHRARAFTEWAKAVESMLSQD
jgi:XTP/dITP diphosphohydrolase